MGGGRCNGAHENGGHGAACRFTFAALAPAGAAAPTQISSQGGAAIEVR